MVDLYLNIKWLMGRPFSLTFNKNDNLIRDMVLANRQIRLTIQHKAEIIAYWSIENISIRTILEPKNHKS